MRAVWAMVFFGFFIEALAIAAGVHPVWLVLFAVLWLAVFIPLVRGIRTARTRW